jgi:hypothetical protein
MAEHCYAECHYAVCRYAECGYAECHYATCRYAERRYANSRGAVTYSSIVRRNDGARTFNRLAVLSVDKKLFIANVTEPTRKVKK